MKSLLQYFLLRKAIEEEGLDFELIEKNSNPQINHRNCVVDFKEFQLGLKYPKSYIRAIDDLPKEKKYEFCFIGYFGKSREKLLKKFQNKNSHILNSSNGRKVESKYRFDKEYFSKMSSSRYCLVPNHDGDWYNHDDAWTYRFVESLLCKSIPILFRETPLGKNFIKSYHYLWNDEIENLSNEKYSNFVDENYEMALKEFSLQSNEIESLSKITKNEN
jgi:hypothetical protein